MPACSGVRQRDATGAGDAFLGGVVAALYARMRASPAPAAWLPTSQAELLALGSVAAAAGAACVEVVGALPVVDVR